MQNNKNRKGLALGAVFALIASLFVGTAPAQANESAVVAFPASGLETQTTMLGDQGLQLEFRFGNNVAESIRSFTSPTHAAFGLIVTKPAGVTVSATVSARSGIQAATNTASDAVDTAGTEFVTGFAASGAAVVEVGLPNRTSVSAAVSITVTPFLDLDRDGVRDNGETLGTPIVLNFVPWSAMGAVLTLTEPIASRTAISASMVVTAGTLNWAQIDGNFTIVLDSTNDGAATASATFTAANLSSTTNASASNTARGNYSASAVVGTAALTTSGTVQSVSASINFNGDVLVAASTTKVAVTALSIAGLTMSPVVGANITNANATSANARYNSAFVLNAYAHTTSETTSMAVARAFTVSDTAGLELDADSGIIIAGVTHTSSATLMKAGLTLAAGTNTVAISTFGQDYDASDYITFILSSQLQTDTYTVNFAAEGLTVEYTATAAIVSAAGAPRTFALDVVDQWGEETARLDLRVKATVDLGSSVSDPVYATVAGSAASVTVTPVPATRTGSATVTFTLQEYTPNTRSWADLDSHTETWNVYSYAAGTDAFVSRTVSVSGTISYGVVAYSWSDTITAVVANSFSTVVVSAPGLVIQNVDVPAQTASGTLTVAANGKNVNVKFAGPRAGTFTVTFTNGTAVTTSQVVIAAAADNAGATITFDTTAIAAGSTRVITGTLVDANGNPVHTSGSATILVTYTVTGNAGIPIGTMPTETDADGEFTITVLTGANDSGTAVVSATYYKSGAATPVAQVLTFNQSIVVGGAATAPASDQKLTVGSFKGFVAIYALNYTGQKLSAKVAGKWLVVNELTRFQRVVRNTGAGYTIKVDLHIDGVFVRSETVVTK